MEQNNAYRRGFIPYALSAFLIGIVGGFSSVLGPAFVADLGIAYRNTTWTALAQAVPTAACSPILGQLGDRIGRKQTLLLGLVLFTLGNALSALANSLWVMIAARFMIGTGTAAMAPVILAYIATQFPPDQTATGFSLYLLISSAAVMIGPTLGSWIISRYGWRSMLWVCTVICMIICALCLALLPKKREERTTTQPFDSSGTIFVFLFFSLLLCVPSFGQNFGWRSPWFVTVLFLALGSLIGLIFSEIHAPFPILPASFLRRKSFLLSVLALILTQCLMQANMTNTIVFVRTTQPDAPDTAGYAISVMYLGMSLGAILLGPLADHAPPKVILLCSMVITGIGCGLIRLFTTATSSALLMASLGMLGLGLGGNGTILMKLALRGLPQNQAGTGTGIYSLFRDLAAPIGVAVLIPLFTNQLTLHASNGFGEAEAAVRAIHTLSFVELLCIIGGILVAMLIPNKPQGELNP